MSKSEPGEEPTDLEIAENWLSRRASGYLTGDLGSSIAEALFDEYDRRYRVERAAARFIKAGLCGNDGTPGGTREELRALIEAVRTNPAFDA